MTAPPDLLGVEATGSLTDVALGNATVSDDSGETLFAMPEPNGPFPLGGAEVIWMATDSAGNTGANTQLVSVVDTTPPVVTAPADITATAGTSIVLGEPTVEDAVGIDAASVSNDWPGGDFPAGTTTVTWTASDTSGNVGTDTQLVTITAALVPLDLDIAGFKVTKRVRTGRSQSVDFTLRVENASRNDVDFGSATLVGRLGATEVYRVTVMDVADPPGGGWTGVDLPPFTPDASMAGGTIIWEVTIQDGDPDVDVATASTTVVP